MRARRGERGKASPSHACRVWSTLRQRAHRPGSLAPVICYASCVGDDRGGVGWAKARTRRAHADFKTVRTLRFAHPTNGRYPMTKLLLACAALILSVAPALAVPCGGDFATWLAGFRREAAAQSISARAPGGLVRGHRPR